MSFLRHRGVYQSDEIRKGRVPKDTPPLIGVDEPPTGYSLTSCSPTLLVSASPAGNHFPINGGRCQSAVEAASVVGIGLDRAQIGPTFRAAAITLAKPISCPTHGGKPTISVI